MGEKCERCPCPDVCLGWVAFCAWAAEDPPDEIKIRHIQLRSAYGKTEGRSQNAEQSGDTANFQPSTLTLKSPKNRPDVSEALARVRAIRACSFRSIDPACGCAGGRCGLRRGDVVSHVDCMDCVRRYPDP